LGREAHEEPTGAVAAHGYRRELPCMLLGKSEFQPTHAIEPNIARAALWQLLTVFDAEVERSAPMVHLKPHGARIRAALPTRPAGQSVEEALVRFLEISQRLLQRRARQRAEPRKAWLVAKSRELLRELVVADTLAPLAPGRFAPSERPIPHVAA